MTNLHERVTVRFRQHERTVPLAAVAISFRRSAEKTATTLEFLTQGPPEKRSPSPLEDSTSRPASPHELHGEGVGGGARSERSETMRSETFGPETFRSETIEQKSGERSDPQRSERERRAREGGDPADDAELARQIAVDLGDEENVGAIRKLVASYPRPLLELALRRTLEVPAGQVRSTRGAIFTGILRKLAPPALRQPTHSPPSP